MTDIPFARTVCRCLAILVASATLAGCDRGPAAPADPQAGSAAKPASTPLSLDGVVVIGASVSAGSEVSLPEFPGSPFQGAAGLADALGAIADAPTPPTFADVFFFMNPTSIAEAQIAAAKKLNPRIVFAIDFLFWHLYGAGLSDRQRLELFRKGLDRLASLDAAIVVADIPDMAHAVGKLLSPAQLPPVHVQEQANQILAEWAAARENVTLLSLRSVVAAAMNQQQVTLAGINYSGPGARTLLTDTGIHATAEGLVAVTLECLVKLRDNGLLPATVSWESQPAAVIEKMVERRRASAETGSFPGDPPPPAPGPR